MTLQMKINNTTLTEEFVGAAREVIRLVNLGKLTIRTRGKKKESITKTIQDLRRKIVDVFKKSGTRAKDLYRAVVVEVWRQENDNKDTMGSRGGIQALELDEQFLLPEFLGLPGLRHSLPRCIVDHVQHGVPVSVCKSDLARVVCVLAFADLPW
jgi:hypothetical protein